MSAFSEMQDLLSDFLTEASELLDDVDVGLIDLEYNPEDTGLLNRIFRGFHTVKGGAGFLEATPLVELCHRGENLLDLLRTGALKLTPEIMDVILAATGEVRRMFAEMERGAMPEAAPAELLRGLEAAARGESASAQADSQLGSQADSQEGSGEGSQEGSRAWPAPTAGAGHAREPNEPDWQALYVGAFGTPPEGLSAAPVDNAPGAAPAAKPAAKPFRPEALAQQGSQKEVSIRVDTVRFDQILNLSGEIGLTKNRLNCLREELLANYRDDPVAETLDAVFGQLDTLVSDLQSAVMKARMQPVGRVFQRYNRLARDLARQMRKEVDLIIVGGETEVDKTILDELNDPLVHLIRNSVDHGVEQPEERVRQGKPERGTIHLSARQTGDSIVIEVADDGKGMDPEVIRQKAIEKGAISADEAASLDPQRCLQLIFLPGFSTKANVSDVSGRGVGMDVVRTNIVEKLKGTIEIQSAPGQGTKMVVSLPLTLAILPVMMLKVLDQTYAVPLSIVREIIPIDQSSLQRIGNAPTLTVRGEVLPVLDMATLLGRHREQPAELAVIVASGDKQAVIGVDGFIGQDEVMIKPLEGLHPKGVAGATLAGDGTLVLVLELKQLLEEVL